MAALLLVAAFVAGASVPSLGHLLRRLCHHAPQKGLANPQQIEFLEDGNEEENTTPFSPDSRLRVNLNDDPSSAHATRHLEGFVMDSPAFSQQPSLAGLAPDDYMHLLNETDAIPSFGVYAAQRILADQDGSQLTEHEIVSEALRTIGDAYLRAQADNIVECIRTYKLDNVCLTRQLPPQCGLAMLQAQAEGVLRGMPSMGMLPSSMQSQMSTSGSLLPNGATRVMAASCGALPALARRRHVLSLLLLEYEGLLCEYLSVNWDRMDALIEANKGAVNYEGQACVWNRQSSMPREGPSSFFAAVPPVTRVLSRIDSDESMESGRTTGSFTSTPGQGDGDVERKLQRTAGSFGSNPQFLNHLSTGSANKRGSRSLGSLSATASSLGSNDSVAMSSMDSTAASVDAAADTGDPSNGSTRSRKPGSGVGSGVAFTVPRPDGRALWRRARRAANKAVAMKILRARNTKTMADIFKDLQRSQGWQGPLDGNQQQQEKPRQPVLLFLGGGMAAGKSSVRRLIGQDVFWSKIQHPVIVEADAIKSQDAVFLELSKHFPNDPSIANLVHEYSTETAEKLLVQAVNENRDIVFDGTLMWRPFVEQTIAMVRDHHHFHKRGPGYRRDLNGHVMERYWERCSAADVECCDSNATPQCCDLGANGAHGSSHGLGNGCTASVAAPRVPYRIEIVGCTCDPGLAVARGLWRFFRERRGVPVAAQLRSHKLFAANWEYYASLADAATLYHTGHHLTTLNKKDNELQPMVIAHMSQATRGQMLVNPLAYRTFLEYRFINEDATNRLDLYCNCSTEDVEAVPAVPVSDPLRLCQMRKMLCSAERFASNMATFEQIQSQRPQLPRLHSVSGHHHQERMQAFSSHPPAAVTYDGSDTAPAAVYRKMGRMSSLKEHRRTRSNFSDIEDECVVGSRFERLDAQVSDGGDGSPAGNRFERISAPLAGNA